MSTVDMTRSLFGSTVYIESGYYPGWWIGASDHYNGYIFEESEHSVFNPTHPCRIEVIDCDGGWACLRTRYRESGRGVYSDNVTQSRDLSLRSDARSWYLEADSMDVDFSQNTASPSDKGAWFKWKILCASSNLDTCYIENGYYPGAQIYAHMTGSLDTAYRSSGDDDSWFRHRVMRPEFSQLSQEGEMVGELCNYAEDVTIEQEFSYTEGIRVDVAFGMSVGVSVSEEVHVGCGLASASGSISSSWEAEMSTSSTWEESQTTTISMPVPPGKCMIIRRMTGVYGTPYLSPYTIGAHNYNVYEHDVNAK